MTQTQAAAAAEIKISLSGDGARKAACAFGLKSSAGQSRTIHFWDVPRKGGEDVVLPFLDRGVIFRLRLDDSDRGAKRKGDMTVKLRPCPPLPPDWRKDIKNEDEDWKFTIEEDRTGPDFTSVPAASLQADDKFEATLVRSALASERGAPNHLLSDPHHALLEDAVGLKKGDLSDLRALGPVYTLKWKQQWDELSVAVEEWTVKDLRFLEVSVRTTPADAADTGRRLERALRERAVEPPRSGETKTRMALTVLARDLVL